MKLGREALPGFKCWKAVMNFLCEKVSEIFTGSGDVVLQRSETCLEKQVEMTCNQQPHISHF